MYRFNQKRLVKKGARPESEREETCAAACRDQGWRRNGAKLVEILNRYSLLFHVFLACGICFVIEWISRHSFWETCRFVTDRGLVFLYNSLLIYASLMFVYIFKRRAVVRMIIAFFWIFLGTINGCILLKRVTPFSFTDLKMVSDLFTMQSNYFTAMEATVAIALVALTLLSLVVLWFKGPKFSGTPHRMVSALMTAAVLLMIPSVTNAAVSNHILAEYFENIAQGYKDYGFVYSFSASVLDRGMSMPENYSEEAIQDVLAKTSSGDDLEQVPPDRLLAEASLEAHPSVRTSSAESEEYPNIICVLLESFVDPTEINFLELSEDPVPNFRSLYETYSSGHLEVPVVGAGTANTEFEILTGMGMQFFGLGEYPYKTILKQTDCESVASDLSDLGYGTHAVHNNGGNFYSRANAFSMMGFDTFTCKEMMDITEYTPLGTWPTDDILIGEVEKSLDYTPDQQDFVYTITVEGHGDYPHSKVLEDPAIDVGGVEDEGERYAWEYYVNQMHEVDDFIGDLIAMLEERGEPTYVVMFGDHLPTMGLEEQDMATGSLFLTKYATWNNLGMEKEDEDLTSYQLLAHVLDTLGIHTGTMFRYHQNRGQFATEQEYLDGMELLQYDILYGERYVYGGEDPYPATDLVMGTQDVVVQDIYDIGKYYYLTGENFTKWSKVYINGSKIGTKYISSRMVRIAKKNVDEGVNEVVVKQLGSSETVFRESNVFYFEREPETEMETETETEAEMRTENGLARMPR